MMVENAGMGDMLSGTLGILMLLVSTEELL